MPTKNKHALCKALLDEIQESVSVFKPSKSLYAFSNLEICDRDHSQAEVDLVISGGALKGYYVAGCSHILQAVFLQQGIRIMRIAGASAGAWAGLFMLTNLGTENWIESYYRCQNPGVTIHEAYQEMWPWIDSILPDNAAEICSGRLFISITELTIWGPRNKMISKFSSKHDLFEACLASSTVPFVTERYGIRKFRDMWVIDGGVTSNTPVFQDDIRRQLVFKLFDVDYPLRLLINPKDSCIEALVVRGALAMASFLRGETAGVGSEMAWVERKGSSKASKADKSAHAFRPQSTFLPLPLWVGGSLITAGVVGLFFRSSNSGGGGSGEHYSRMARQMVLQPAMLLLSIVRTSVQPSISSAV